MSNQQNHIAMEQLTNYILESGRRENKEYFQVEKRLLENKSELTLASLETEKQQRLKKMRESVEQEFQQKMQREELLKNQALVLKKQDYLDQVINEVTNAMKNWPKDHFIKMITPIFISNDLHGHIDVILASFSREFIDQELLDNFSQQHESTISYQLSDTIISNDGGFILSQDGIEYNYLYSSIQDQLSEEMEVEIVKFLFEDEVS